MKSDAQIGGALHPLPPANTLKELEARLAEMDSERDAIQARIRVLRESAASVETDVARPVSSKTFPDAPLTKASAPTDRIRFLLDLLHARRDVYAERFESRKTGKAGYQPVCANLWRRPLCQKPKVRCHECQHRILVPLSEEIVAQHLSGKVTLGIYPLLSAETCWFVAADFDKEGWQEDALSFVHACRNHGVEPAIERSRSGKGGHVWAFFGEEVLARTARQMAAALITEAMVSRPSMGLDSYDRLLPSQDTMPKGGFGNLIALPLQRLPAHKGNSLFVDDDLRIYPDQWAFLSSLPRVSASHVERLAGEARAGGKVVGVRPVSMIEGQDDPWTLPPSRMAVKTRRTTERVPESIEVVLSDEVYVPKNGLPPALLNEVVRLAAFQNPEFYRAQAMRLPVYGKPRVIGCASDSGKHIGLPRGCLDDLRTLMAEWGVQLRVDDKRVAGTAIPARFVGQLRPEQVHAAEVLLRHDYGILAAGTAFGKTVVAISVLASRAVNTLILVHRRQLMDQWVERLTTFLDLRREEIGIIGGGKRKPTGCVDVAILQSLRRRGEVDDLVADYGHLIVDECHHVSARTFEMVARRCRVRYVTGLSATVVRQDGHHPIVIMQCGPIRFRTDARQDADLRPFTHSVHVRRTGFHLSAPQAPAEGTAVEAPIQDIFRQITEDETRNALIAEQALSALREGRSPVLLTERRKHLEWFQVYLQHKVERLVVLHGGMGQKKRRAAWDVLQATTASGTPRLVLATGKYLGEGFDDARLDALLLAMPISWKGTVAQYAGRLHRLYTGKQAVVIYDFVDDLVPVLARMFERRKRGYASLGYSIAESPVPDSVRCPANAANA